MTVDAPFRISSTILRCVSYLDPVTFDSTIPGSIATLYDNHMRLLSFRNTQGYVPVARKNCLTLEELNLLLSKRLFLFYVLKAFEALTYEVIMQTAPGKVRL